MTRENRSSAADEKHWLQRPENIRKLWWIFGGILLLTVVAQFGVEVHDHFGADGLFGFSAMYGFGTCVAMVVVAKVLGWWLKRSETYYPEETLFRWTDSMARATDWKPEEMPEHESGRKEGGDD